MIADKGVRRHGKMGRPGMMTRALPAIASSAAGHAAIRAALADGTTDGPLVARITRCNYRTDVLAPKAQAFADPSADGAPISARMDCDAPPRPVTISRFPRP